MTTETKTPPKAIESLQNKKDCLKAFGNQIVELEKHLGEIRRVAAVVQASVDAPDNEELHREATRTMIAHVIRLSLEAGRPEVVTAMLVGDFERAAKVMAA